MRAVDRNASEVFTQRWLDSVTTTLRKERQVLNISTKALAERLGCSREHLARIELGATAPSLTLLLTWCEVLGFSLELTHK